MNYVESDELVELDPPQPTEQYEPTNDGNDHESNNPPTSQHAPSTAQHGDVVPVIKLYREASNSTPNVYNPDILIHRTLFALGSIILKLAPVCCRTMATFVMCCARCPLVGLFRTVFTSEISLFKRQIAELPRYAPKICILL